MNLTNDTIKTIKIYSEGNLSSFYKKYDHLLVMKRATFFQALQGKRISSENKMYIDNLTDIIRNYKRNYLKEPTILLSGDMVEYIKKFGVNSFYKCVIDKGRCPELENFSKYNKVLFEGEPVTEECFEYIEERIQYIKDRLKK